MFVPQTRRRLFRWAAADTFLPVASRLTLTLSILVAATRVATAQVVVFAPHPDDEALIASGIINQAKQSGKTIKVVLATNGDCKGGTIGFTRELETVSAMSRLGLPEDDIIFLGYPDCGLYRLYYSYTSPTSQFTSADARTQTYAAAGLGRTDYHSYIYGTPGLYNGPTMIQDIVNVLRNYRPQDVYVTSAYDANPDHWVLNLMVGDALLSTIRADATFQPTLHDALVHEPCELSCNPSYHWPMPTFTPTTDFPAPPYLSMTPLGWSDVESVVVPAAMTSTSTATNLKYQTIAQYVTQGGSGNTWLESFVKHNEIFWKWELWSNLALKATATASSSYAADTTPDRVNDGSVVGYPLVPSDGSGRGKGEWVSNNQLAGAWVQLTWPTAQPVVKIVLHDRPDTSQNITGGTLSFSDGTSIAIGSLPTNGVGVAVQFTQKNVTWVRFTATAATGRSAGLAELEVYGPAAAKLPPAGSNNIAPFISNGPSASPGTIVDTATSTLSVTASDANNDPLSYAWTPSGGQITGSGATVTFVPPTVTATMVFRIDVVVSDGRGGTASSFVQVTVNPSNSPPSITAGPTATPSTITDTQTSLLSVTASDPNGDPLTYAWRAPAGSIAGTGATATFTPPRVTSSTTYRIDLQVSDNRGGSTSGFVNVTVNPTTIVTNRAPVIGAGPTATPSTISDIATSTVSVTASDPDGDPLTYAWQTTGGTITGSGANVTFTPPRLTTATTFRVTVTVSDGRGGTVTGFVDVPVTPSGTLANVALSATATASAENVSRGQTAAKAIDGFVDGYPNDSTREWVAPGATVGAWIQLTWSAARTITRVVLHDRINTVDQIVAGTLTFSDGSSLAVGSLPNSGTGLQIDFSSRTVTWVRLTITSARGENTGLAEFEVY